MGGLLGDALDSRLGLTAEATSLRLFVGGLLGDALDSRLGLTAEATSLRPDT